MALIWQVTGDCWPVEPAQRTVLVALSDMITLM